MCQFCPTELTEKLRNHTMLGVDLRDIGEVRKLLTGPDACASDEVVTEIRDLVEEFADLAFDWWQTRRARELAESDGTPDN